MREITKRICMQMIAMRWGGIVKHLILWFSEKSMEEEVCIKWMFLIQLQETPVDEMMQWRLFD